MESSKNFLNFLTSLIKTPSLSGHEEKVAELIFSEMKKLDYDDIFIDELGSVVGIINEGKGRTLCLNGHIDHVPEGNLENWHYPPYSATIVDNVLYGRGTADMKGAVASMVYAAAKARETNKIKGKLVVAAVVLEELQEGIAMKNIVEQHGIVPDLVILGEATRLNLAIGHRGRAELEIVVSGKTSHASMPELADNAVFKALPFLNELKDINEQMPQHPVLGKGTLALTRIISEPSEGPITPDKCKIYLDRRFSVPSTEEDVLKEIEQLIEKAKIPKKDVHFRILESELLCYTGKRIIAKRFFPKWFMDRESDIVKEAVQALNMAGLSPDVITWRFGTDGSYTAGERNIPTIGFGPGDERLAHQPNEHISLSDIYKAIDGYVSLISNFLRS